MLAAVVLVLLVAVAGLAPRRGVRWAIALAAVSVLWLAVNRPMEGPVLWRVSDSHGLTGGDLAGVAGLALAAWRALAPRRRHPSGSGSGGSTARRNGPTVAE